MSLYLALDLRLNLPHLEARLVYPQYQISELMHFKSRWDQFRQVLRSATYSMMTLMIACPPQPAPAEALSNPFHLPFSPLSCLGHSAQ